MTNLEEHYQNTRNTHGYIKGYIEYLSGILKQIDVNVIDRIISTLIKASERGSTIYVLGNGGSASIASHMANDLAVGAWMSEYPPLRVVSLNDNVPVMTAIANDTDYSQIFSDQLRYLLQPEDVVIALSVSGNSPNVVKAVQFAKGKGATTIGCGGFDGGRLKQLTEVYLYVPSEPGEYGPVEDVMMILVHIIHSYLLLSRKGTLKHSHE